MKWFKSCLCYWFDHKWVKQTEIEVSTGPRGKGTIIWEECSRCGGTRCRFIADININIARRSTARKQPVVSEKLSPEMVAEADKEIQDDVDRYETETGTQVSIAKPKKERVTKFVAKAGKECPKCGSDKKVQKPTTRNQS